MLSGQIIEQIRESAGTKIIGQSSIKAALDIDWSDADEKSSALTTLLEDVQQVRQWLTTQPESLVQSSPLSESLELLETVSSQNVESDPDGGSRVIDGVTPDRIISLNDLEMKHGRKSSSRTINGYKQHVAVELNSRLILATCVRPANEPEFHAADYLKPDVLNWGEINELQIDRGYLSSPLTTELYDNGKRVEAKPWDQTIKGKFAKKHFKIDLEFAQVTFPEGHTAKIRENKRTKVTFKADFCNPCGQRALCTDSKTGRTITIHEHEAMMIHLRQYTQTVEGRAAARERVKVEHSLASICNRKGPRARYLGIGKMNSI